MSSKHFDRLLSKYHEAAYYYAQHFLMDNREWEASTEDKVVELLTSYAFVRRAMLKYDVDLLRVDLAIPENIGDFLLPDHVKQFEELIEKQNEFVVFSTKIQLDEIDRWIRHLEYSEDAIRYLQSDRLHKMIFKLFMDMDRVFVLKAQHLTPIELEHDQELLSEYMELFHLASRKISRKRSELCIPHVKTYRYWFDLSQQPVRTIVEDLLNR
jgi:hypothetical protein